MLDSSYVKTLMTNIWSYYGTIELNPIVLQDYLMLDIDCFLW